jgi:hypothetical protein
LTISADGSNNILKFSTGKIFIYFLPKANVGTIVNFFDTCPTLVQKHLGFFLGCALHQVVFYLLFLVLSLGKLGGTSFDFVFYCLLNQFWVCYFGEFRGIKYVLLLDKLVMLC